MYVRVYVHECIYVGVCVKRKEEINIMRIRFRMICNTVKIN